MNPKEKYEDRNDLGVFDDYEYMDDDFDDSEFEEWWDDDEEWEWPWR